MSRTLKMTGPRKGSATLSFHLRTLNRHDRMRNLDRLGRSRIRRQNEHCSIFKRRLTVLNGLWALGSNGFKAVRSPAHRSQDRTALKPFNRAPTAGRHGGNFRRRSGVGKFKYKYAQPAQHCSAAVLNLRICISLPS